MKDGTWRTSLYSQLVSDCSDLLQVKIVKTPMMKKYVKDAINGDHLNAEKIVTKATEALQKGHRGPYVKLRDLVSDAQKKVLDMAEKYRIVQAEKELYDKEVDERTVQTIILVIAHISMLMDCLDKMVVNGDFIAEEDFVKVVRIFIQLLVYI